MSEKLSLIVFFNYDELPEPERYHLGERGRVVDRGIQLLKQQFPDLEIGSSRRSACSVDAMASVETAGELEDFLARHPEVGRCMYEGPMLRPASLAMQKRG